MAIFNCIPKKINWAWLRVSARTLGLVMSLKTAMPSLFLWEVQHDTSC